MDVDENVMRTDLIKTMKKSSWFQMSLMYELGPQLMNPSAMILIVASSVKSTVKTTSAWSRSSFMYESSFSGSGVSSAMTMHDAQITARTRMLNEALRFTSRQSCRVGDSNPK